MSTTKLSKHQQFLHENLTWGRSIDFFKQENSFLKNRLSEVVDQESSKEFLALAEQFQNRFILKDEFMDELKHDINTQARMLKDDISNSIYVVSDKNMKRQDKLRNEMEYLERDFTKLKNEFNKYLATEL